MITISEASNDVQTLDNTPEQTSSDTQLARITRGAARFCHPSHILSALLVTGDVTGEFMTTYHAAVGTLNHLFKKAGYESDAISRIASLFLASCNAIGDFAAGNESLQNSVSSFGQILRERKCDKELAISAIAYVIALIAASPDFIFNLDAGMTMSDSEGPAVSNASEYASYFTSPAMALAHAIFYYPKIKELLSQSPSTTLKNIYTSISEKTISNNLLRLVALGFATDRIAEFVNTEFSDMVKMVAEDKSSSYAFISLATIAAIGLAPITFCAMDKVANNFYNKLTTCLITHTPHAQLHDHDVEGQHQAHINHHHASHNHGHNGVLFFLAATASSLPPILQAFEESGVSTVGLIRAVILILTAFAIYNQIHDHGHQSSVRNHERPSPTIATPEAVTASDQVSNAR